MKQPNEHNMKTFTARVTQYLRPSGRARHATIELNTELESNYKDMIKRGFKFTAEVLRTGEVSLTVDGKDREVDGEIAANVFGGGPVREAMEKMLLREQWKESDEEDE